jgi:hypothetical protein
VTPAKRRTAADRHDSDDGHTTTVTVDDAVDWRATATCALCDWTASGGTDGVRALAANHADGSDDSR